MKKNLFLYSLCSMVLFFIFSGTSRGQAPGLKKLWQTDGGLKVPEAVTYNESDSLLYISNINGAPTEKNGEGFISRVALDGTIKDLHWISGLNAPKGSAISGTTLFVSDIDQLIEIDISTAKITNKYPARGALFLNDVAAGSDGMVYVSDYSADNSKIYRLRNGALEAWLEGPEISRPNGLFIKGEVLYIGNSGDGKIKQVHLGSKEIKPVADIGSGIDGLRPDGRGNFIISDWSGKTAFVHHSGKVTELLNTTDQKINSADLEFVIKKDLLIIPTFFANSLAAYQLSVK